MNNLITLEDYKDSKGLSSGKEDLRIDSLITSVSQLVKTYCANSIVDYYDTTKTETFSIRWDTQLIELTETPLRRVSSIEEKQNGVYVDLSEDEYFVDYDIDCIYRVGTDGGYKSWSEGPGSVIVRYTAGYETCPADLKLAVIDLVSYYLKEEYKVRQTLSGATRETPETTLRNGVAFPDHIKRVLDLYKNI